YLAEASSLLAAQGRRHDAVVSLRAIAAIILGGDSTAVAPRLENDHANATRTTLGAGDPVRRGHHRTGNGDARRGTGRQRDDPAAGRGGRPRHGAVLPVRRRDSAGSPHRRARGQGGLAAGEVRPARRARVSSSWLFSGARRKPGPAAVRVAAARLV